MTTSALSVPRFRFSAQATQPERLASAVLASPRLLATVPAAELKTLFTAYEAATVAAEKARQLPAAEQKDAVADLDKRLRAGEEIDPAALVDELAAAQIARESRDRTVALLRSMPGRYLDDVVRLIGDHKGLFWEDLGEALDNLLDQAATVVAELDGIDSADAAIDGGKAEEWTRLKGLVREYASIRADHVALLRTEDNRNFHPNAPALAYAYFGGLADEIPDFTQVVRGESRDAMGRAAELPWPIFDVDAVGHLLAVVRRRERLRPRIGRPEDAFAAKGEADSRLAEGRPMEPGRLAQWHGGEQGVLRSQFHGGSRVMFGPRSDLRA